MTTPVVAALYRYPVKGMTPEPMQRVALDAGGTMPFDRAYAIENGPGRFDPDAPRHLPKINFVMLMRNERLASLDTRFDDATHTLTIMRAGRQVARGNLETAIGRQLIEQFLAAYMKTDLRGAPNIHLDGLPAFAEIDWIGRDLRIGTSGLSVFDRTVRCDATNVDPATAARDMAIPALLQRTWGRTDFGVYARITEAGGIGIGDALSFAA